MMLCVHFFTSTSALTDQLLSNRAKEFSRSAIARDSDFSTNSLERGTFYMEEVRRAAPIVELDDSPESRGILSTPRRRKRKVRGSLIVQFAANDGQQLADAAELVKPWVDGIDLNCGGLSSALNLASRDAHQVRRAGCPQKWAYQEGIGCALLRKPELVRDLVRSIKQRVGWDFPVSVKIRVDPDLTCVVSFPVFFSLLADVSPFQSLTNELVRTAIAAGADILTVHGRTRHQSSSGHPVNLESLAFAVECARGDIPCMANGDVFTLEDAEETRRKCNVRGVMSARGLLANPVILRFWAALAVGGVDLLTLDILRRQALFAGHSQTPLSAISVRPLSFLLFLLTLTPSFSRRNSPASQPPSA